MSNQTEGNMRIAMHQPHFFPWLGYFDRLRHADLFILLDTSPYESDNFQDRVRIKREAGTEWISVPLETASSREAIADMRIRAARPGPASGRRLWAREALRAIETSYAHAPHFQRYYPQVAGIFAAEWEKLVDLDQRSIEFLMGALGIRTPVIRASSLGVTGEKTALALRLCRAVKADALLCGLGDSRGCLDAGLLKREGVTVEWQEFRHPRYEQHPSPERFEPGLSALDLLFNRGPQAGRVLRGETEAVSGGAHAE
jgi:hypothetical protein